MRRHTFRVFGGISTTLKFEYDKAVGKRIATVNKAARQDYDNNSPCVKDCYIVIGRWGAAAVL